MRKALLFPTMLAGLLAFAAPALAQAPLPGLDAPASDGRSPGDASSAQQVELIARPALVISGTS